MNQHPNRPIKLAALFVVLVAGWCPADDSPPVAALKAKGLIKTGHVFAHEEAEKPALEKMKEVKAVANIYSQAADRQLAAEQAVYQLAQLDQSRVEIQTNLDNLNQQINQQSAQQQGGTGRNRVQQQQNATVMNQLVAQRNQYKAGLDEVALEQKTLKANIPQGKARAELDDDVKKKGEAFKAALAELRPMVDEVTRKYADIAADPSVKASLAEVAKMSKAAANVGPSDAFQAGTKALEQAERRFLGKKPTPAAKKKVRTKAK